MVRVLAALGCGFDCASAKEMKQVLALGVDPDRIVFAHPCKRPVDLAFAVDANVTVRALCAIPHCKMQNTTALWQMLMPPPCVLGGSCFGALHR